MFIDIDVLGAGTKGEKERERKVCMQNLSSIGSQYQSFLFKCTCLFQGSGGISKRLSQHPFLIYTITFIIHLRQI